MYFYQSQVSFYIFFRGIKEISRTAEANVKLAYTRNFSIDRHVRLARSTRHGGSHVVLACRY